MPALWWIPNGLSLLRLTLGLAFPVVPSNWRLPVIAIAALTDFLDGFLARRWNAGSDTGRWLDPLADKVFVLALLATLLAEGAISPVWAAAILARDVAVTAAVIVVLRRGQRRDWNSMRPRWLGKLTTALQFVLLLLLVINPQEAFPLVVITAAVSVAAAADYLIFGIRRMRERPA